MSKAPTIREYIADHDPLAVVLCPLIRQYGIDIIDLNNKVEKHKISEEDFDSMAVALELKLIRRMEHVVDIEIKATKPSPKEREITE